MDSFGFFNPALEQKLSKKECRLRYKLARLDYLRSSDDLERMIHSIHVLYFRRVGKFTLKEINKMNNEVRELYRAKNAH